MIDPKTVLMNMMQNNPNFQNNPVAQNYVNVLLSGDSKRGEEIANNLLKSYGVTKEQALDAAKKMFNLH